jgi:hypothetical protein
MHLRAKESDEVLGLDFRYLSDAPWECDEGGLVVQTGQPEGSNRGSGQSATSEPAPGKDEKQV